MLWKRRRGGAPSVEIAHGEAIRGAGEEVWNWSTPAGRERLRRRVDLFEQHLGLDAPKKRVLELGCGTGLYTEQIAPLTAELVAVDISDALIGEARPRVAASSPNVRFVRANLEAIDPDKIGRGFDAAFGCSVLHHLDLDRALPGLREVLAPGALVAFSEPNLLNPQVQLMFSGLEWAKRRWAVSDTEMAFTPWELRSAFARHGYHVLELFPFDLVHPGLPERMLPIAKRMSRAIERLPLVRYLGGSFFVAARKI